MTIDDRSTTWLNHVEALASASPESPGGLYDLASEIFPICRSITGEGVRLTLAKLASLTSGLEVRAVPSGTQCFDWFVPDEWTIRGAYIIGPSGEKIIDFSDNNLHVVGYSVAVDTVLPLDELQTHLHSIPELPNAIPYVTSYYERTWGFCLTQRQRDTLTPGNYRAVVDSTLAPGVLNYGEIVIAGRSRREILLSTYVCHPSMANNEVSGPVLAAFLARWIERLPSREFSYRILFVPETIGAIAYLSTHRDALRSKVVAGFILTCVGDDRTYSFLPSRLGGTLADRVAEHVLRHHAPSFDRYTFLDRGSDERQYCSPGVDLPVVSMMRSKYSTYPEYHTSLDDLSVISESGFAGAFEAHAKLVLALERNTIYQAVHPCEPQMSRHGLYRTLGTRSRPADTRGMMNLLAYADGSIDLIGIADALGQPVELCDRWARPLLRASLLRVSAAETAAHAS